MSLDLLGAMQQRGQAEAQNWAYLMNGLNNYASPVRVQRARLADRNLQNIKELRDKGIDPDSEAGKAKIAQMENDYKIADEKAHVDSMSGWEKRLNSAGAFLNDNLNPWSSAWRERRLAKRKAKAAAKMLEEREPQ
jgi:hypothetical protein